MWNGLHMGMMDVKEKTEKWKKPGAGIGVKKRYGKY